MRDYHLLSDFIGAFVPLKMLEYEQRGGPKDYEFDAARDYWQAMIERGDGEELLFREKGKTGRSTDALINLIAIMAFAPGGIHIFGHHFEDGKRNTAPRPAMQSILKEQG